MPRGESRRSEAQKPRIQASFAAWLTAILIRLAVVQNKGIEWLPSYSLISANTYRFSDAILWSREKPEFRTVNVRRESGLISDTCRDPYSINRLTIFRYVVNRFGRTLYRVARKYRVTPLDAGGGRCFPAFRFCPAARQLHCDYWFAKITTNLTGHRLNVSKHPYSWRLTDVVKHKSYWYVQVYERPQFLLANVLLRLKNFPKWVFLQSQPFQRYPGPLRQLHFYLRRARLTFSGICGEFCDPQSTAQNQKADCADSSGPDSNTIEFLSSSSLSFLKSYLCLLIGQILAALSMFSVAVLETVELRGATGVWSAGVGG
jgi:hypothetical protein